MKLPKYKQPMYDKYINTDFNQYGLTEHQKEVYDKIFMKALKSSYCLALPDGFDKETLKVLKNKGLIKQQASLISVKIIDDVLKARNS